MNKIIRRIIFILFFINYGFNITNKIVKSLKISKNLNLNSRITLTYN
jgi:hypothetical protein